MENIRNSRKILTFLLIGIIMLGGTQVDARAWTMGIGDPMRLTPGNSFKYDVVKTRDGSDGICLRGFIKGRETRNLIIPETIDGLPVTEVYHSAFANEKIDRLRLPTTMQEVGQSAFNNCEIQTFIYSNMDDSVAYNETFRRNNIRSLYVEEGVKEIKSDDSVINNILKPRQQHSNLLYIQFPSTLERLGARIFNDMGYDAYSLEKVIVFTNAETVIETETDRNGNVTRPFTNKKTNVVLMGLDPSTTYDFVKKFNGVLPGVTYPATSKVDRKLIFKPLISLERNINGVNKELDRLDIGEEFTYNIKLNPRDHFYSGSLTVVEEFHDLYNFKDVKVVGGNDVKTTIAEDGKSVSVDLELLENKNEDIEIIFTGSLDMPASGKTGDIVTKSIAYIDGYRDMYRCHSNETVIKDINTNIEVMDIDRSIDGSGTEKNGLEVNEKITYRNKIKLGEYLRESKVDFVEEYDELFNVEKVEVIGLDNYTDKSNENEARIEIPVTEDILEKEIEVLVTGSYGMPKDEKSIDIVSKSILKGSMQEKVSNETKVNKLKTEEVRTSYELKIYRSGTLVDIYTLEGRTGKGNAPNYINDLNAHQSDLVYGDVMEDSQLFLLENPESKEELSWDSSKNKREINFTIANRMGEILIKYVDEDGKDIAPREKATGKVPTGERYIAKAKNIDGYKLKDSSKEESVLYIDFDKIKLHVFEYIKTNKK